MSRMLLISCVVVPLVVVLALSAFAWPAAHLAPRDLPLGVAGPGRAEVEARLARAPETFALHRYADAAAARAAIRDREVYAAVVAGPSGNTLLTASAASPLVAQLLPQALTPALGGAPRVVDVVPADPEDPRGSVLGAAVLPLVLAGLMSGILLSLAVPSSGARAAGLVLAAVASGLAVVAVAEGWLGVIPGPWPRNAAVVALTVLAIAATVAGLVALLGRPGIAVAALLMVLVGNPFSGLTSAPELLPERVGLIGQLLPPGAGGSLLRASAFFDGAHSGAHVLVLCAWIAAGLAALWAGAALRRRPAARSAAA